MLHWSLVFLVIAIIAAILGFGGIAGAAAGFAKILFFVFLVVVAGVCNGPPVRLNAGRGRFARRPLSMT